MLLKRRRLPRSLSGRLIQSVAIFSSNGMAASVPTGMSAMAVAWRAGRLSRSATSKPRPRPRAVTVRVRSGSKGRALAVFGMDNESGIAYSYTSGSEKETGNCCNRVKNDDEFTAMKEIYALILAGGSGERFWPLSRRALPKQLLRLVSGCSLLEAAITRLDGLIPPSRILVLTNVDQEKGVRELLKDIPAGNIIAEPSKRDTAAAVALGVAWVAARNHTAAMVVLPADHVIKETAAFQKIIRDAVEAAKEKERTDHDWDLTCLGRSGFWLY